MDVKALFYMGPLFRLASKVFSNAPEGIILFFENCAAHLPSPLPFAEFETRYISNLFPEKTSPLLEQDATAQALLASLVNATHLHISCHSYFNPLSPSDSSLILAQDSCLHMNDLSNPDWQSKLQNLQLVTLSACQTALSDFRNVPDESFGFPFAFLAAGVSSVIGTLWSVNDLSTAILMLRFYFLYLYGDQQTHLEPYDPSKALRFAQIWMRDSKNIEKRYFLEKIAPDFKTDHPEIWESLYLLPDGKLFSQSENWAAFVCYG